MVSINRIALVFLGVIALGGLPVSAQEAPSGKYDLQLSPQLMELLRSEMRALLGGVQSLSAGIAMADWKGVAKTSEQIGASYILEQELTPAQKKELGDALPEYFKRMDSEFHLEARKLEAAASNHDAQLSAFHYYRLIETCAECHAAYATSKFPGFARHVQGGHGH